MKKIISLILTAIIVMSMTVPAFAENSEMLEPSVAEETEVYVSETENGEDAEQSINDEDAIVATLSVCSCMSIPVIAGHTYIYVQNLSDSPLQVGLYEVPAGQGVSAGLLSISVSDGWGIYYNVEAYRENRDNHQSQIWSKTKELTAEDVEKLSNKLTGYLNHWDPFFNCSYFAFTVWNSITGDFLVPLVIPVLSHLVVMVSGEKGALEMYEPETEQIFRQKGYGSSAKLELISEKTLNA